MPPPAGQEEPLEGSLSWVRRLGLVVGLTLTAAQAEAQGPRDTSRLEGFFYVEIAALVCEIELPDETEDGLDRAIRAEQERLRLGAKQIAAIHAKARAQVEADQDLACESVRLLDSPTVGPEDD